MQAIIDAVEEGRLQAQVSVVISDKKDAYILERAKNHGIENHFIDPAQKSREEFDKEITKILEQKKADVILLIGYMRWLSDEFVKRWEGRVINIHPSLLPAFAGLMDRQVHQAVLDSGIKETGCTAHLVDKGKDTGKILVQKKCQVEENDTVDSLKEKVQKLEGEALLEAIQKQYASFGQGNSE
ncbi:MAG: phosphoribosylglycinamide formyltransferase 1 [Parcubacteria group bacterium Gr01-1014_30]|nr:MAG: phosphoribosylglycinamide formyltransferase 1 [Parcubacteria group bacterium Gr01-1014_30]